MKLFATGQYLALICLGVSTLHIAPATAQFGGVPDKPFDQMERPLAPDYGDPSAWAALPDRNDAADVAPENAAIPENQGMARADVFYIHPTTYRGAENWNQDVSMSDVNTWTDISVVARQASAFNGCCRIYAPRYRQAAIAAMATLARGDSRPYELAYGDVVQAWRHYLENWNEGRPFIIVSHSQGTLHALRLLEEELDGTALANNMIAAYVIGIGVTEGAFGRRYKSIPLCTGATDTGCVISWNTFGRNGSAASMVERIQAQYRDKYGTTEGQKLACWNPVGSTQKEGWFEDEVGYGALPGTASAGSLPALVDAPGAECRDGALYTEIPTAPEFDLMVLEGENLHMHDFDLFYGSIRANAVVRTEAFFHQQGSF